MWTVEAGGSKNWLVLDTLERGGDSMGKAGVLVSRWERQPTSSLPGTLLYSLKPLQTGSVLSPTLALPCSTAGMGPLPDRLVPGGSNSPPGPWKPSQMLALWVRS